MELKKKSKYLEAAILAPISDKKKSDNFQRVNKENIEKQVISMPDNSINTIQEDVKTEIIRPKSSLSSKEIYTTASITGIRKKINDDSDTQVEGDEKQNVSSSKVFSNFTRRKMEPIC